MIASNDAFQLLVYLLSHTAYLFVLAHDLALHSRLPSN